jgi:hypothetical protein
MLRVLKEPLLHFMLIGVALFGLYIYLNPGSIESDKRIVVDASRIERIGMGFEKTWNRQPTADELQGLIDDYVLEEIYYRQALAMGLDSNDPVVRRRLRQKMEFFTESLAAPAAPDDAKLQAFLDAHSQDYQQPPRYTFEQRYISLDRADEELDEVLEKALPALRSGAQFDGDPTLLPGSYDQATPLDISRSLGEQFAPQLDNLPLGQWSGPLRSGIGLHFVNVSKRQPAKVAQLDAVRDQVLRDWTYQANAESRDRVNKALLADYTIEVQMPAAGDK